MAIMDFKPSKPNETIAALGYMIPDIIYKLEPKGLEVKDRTEWYRILFQTERVILFSRNEDGSETVILFDMDHNDYIPNKTNLIFTDTGTGTGKYIMEIRAWDLIDFRFGAEKIISDIEKGKRMSNGGVMSNSSNKDN